MFKSYYVVWKPSVGTAPTLAFVLFKSYYVVWKPFFPDTIYLIFFVFKSYYVVWKPHRGSQNILLRQSLNRTM